MWISLNWKMVTIVSYGSIIGKIYLWSTYERGFGGGES
jgi:hypothetical protein